MNKIAILLTACLAGLLGDAANAGEVIASFEGSRNARTASFETDGPWLLRWRINSDYRMNSAFELFLVDTETGFIDSRVLRTREVGNGLKLFRQTGRFRFEVSANFVDWYLTIEALSEEEADEYVPIER